MKKEYIKPVTEWWLSDFSPLMITDSPRPTGYAIDNDDANDDNIIPIVEQQGELDPNDPWGEGGFIDID